ncbi:MAG: hypothetical protein V4850_16360 [Myxococcota bacterium]
MIALAVIATAALVGSVAYLAVVPTGTWLIPILVAAFGAFVTLTQWNIQHDNAERLQHLSDELRRDSMQYELRLKAYIDVIKSAKAILDCALLNVMSADIMPGPSSVLPTRSFYTGNQNARACFQAGGEVLRLLAKPEASRILDAFELTLSKLDVADEEDTYTQGSIETDMGNVEHLRRAVPALERDYRALLRTAREELGTTGPDDER